MSAQSTQVVRGLATAVSTQSQVANRFWITLMTVALFALLPRINPAETQTINLPLGLGSVEPASLYPVLFAVLIVLIVAFAAAHAQQVRAQKLAHEHIDKMEVSVDELHPRELFDMLRQPSVVRVAPLAQSLRGKFQFFATAKDCLAVLWWSSVVYYVLLKWASIGIYFLLPGWALWSIGIRLCETKTLSATLWLPASVAAFALAQVMLTDVLYSTRVLKHISRRSSELKTG